PPRWWPHTHGEPARLALTVEVRAGGATTTIDLGHVGFRALAIDRGADGASFALRVEGVRVFCRGACWTPIDVVGLASTAVEVDRAVAAAAAAGMNMLRVSGATMYGDDALYAACDARGVLVWQDFAFANLDYPTGDAAFEVEAKREARAVLARVEACPSLAILCGGNEVTQQPAMLGLPREAWTSPLFDAWLPDAAREARPDVPYVDNAPSGGAMPFQVNSGVSFYYGVGAYLCPLTDARRAEVRFAAECLAVGQLPASRVIDRLLADNERPPHHPRWKARTPRDRGAGWDYDDVRDHYVGELFGVDPMRLRYGDMERYLALGRVAGGELVYATMTEWRRARSTCAGALVWFLRDLWPGASLGLVDSSGSPKAALHYAARAMQPIAIFFSDEGQSGAFVHVVNDRGTPLEAMVDLSLYRDGAAKVASSEARVRVEAHAAIELSCEQILGRFADTTYAYRFGPPSFDVAHARLTSASGGALGEGFFLPLGLARDRLPDVGLEARAAPRGDGAYVLTVRTRDFAQAVAIDAGAFDPSDDHFHLAPGASREILLSPLAAGSRPSGSVSALNARAAARIVVGEKP
ncbi:MAG TPA: hypothetical protein VGM56_09020, partial [Byssovorax sp.]